MKDVVCALIENPNGELLACKRAAATHLGGHWEFPGGKVEDDESTSDALKREIQEELAVVIEVRDALRPVEWTDGKVSIRLLPYRCELISGDPQLNDHDEIRWCQPDELKQLKWAPADVPILEEWLAGR